MQLSAPVTTAECPEVLLKRMQIEKFILVSYFRMDYARFKLHSIVKKLFLTCLKVWTLTANKGGWMSKVNKVSVNKVCWYG